MTIQTINPNTGEVIKNYEEMSSDEVKKIIDKSYQAFSEWKNTSFEERARPMTKMAKLLREGVEKYAKLMADEMGKPLAYGRSEIEKCASVCEHYAKNAKMYLDSRPVKTEMKKSYVVFKPIGVIFAIMPWNFPFWQVYRFAAPTLMAGNAGLLKHAPISTGTALAIEELFKEANFPKDLFRTLILSNEGAAEVIANPKVAAVTLTGSGKAGEAVGSAAGKALKKAVLELGGSDPYVVLEDADLEIAATACVTSRLINTGQACIAAKRIIAVKPIHDELIQLIEKKMQNYKMGDPLDEKNNIGPLAREDIRDGVHSQVEKSINNGAKLIVGGKVPAQKGFYYPPTLLTQVKPGMPAYDEEIFGPVISVIEAKDEADAIRIANDTCYGLGGAVFTKDLARGEKIAADEIHTGTCAVNTYVASDPRLPFGGVKASGYGRELSLEGIHAFVNAKTVSIK